MIKNLFVNDKTLVEYENNFIKLNSDGIKELFYCDDKHKEIKIYDNEDVLIKGFLDNLSIKNLSPFDEEIFIVKVKTKYNILFSLEIRFPPRG